MSAATDRPPDDRWVHCYRAIGDDEFPDIGRVHEVPIVPFTDSDPFPFDRPIAAIVELPHEMLEITELSPYDGTFVGKRIQRDGSIAPYPMVTHWRQTVVRIPATIPALADYLEQARKRNICLIRGTPADLARKKTRRQKAGGDRGDHGFTDEPTKLLFFDIDGAAGNWRDDPEAAVKHIVAQLGEPWASASFVWFFSAGHGLEMETVTVGDKKHKRWTGGISDDKIRVRLAFITDRALTWREAAALTAIVKAASGLPLDEAICRTVQPNYITRPLWDGHPGRDALGDTPTIGWVGGGADVTVTVTTNATVTTTMTATVAVPDDLAHQARWAAAQGHDVVIADHPDAISAVRGIGSDGRVRQHMMAAIMHLLKANPPRDHISSFDHSLALADQLNTLIRQHEAEISTHLAAHGRQWGDLAGYLDGMSDWGRWLIERPGAFHRKTVKLTHENPDDDASRASTQEIYDRVARTIRQWKAGVTLLIAPTGSRKSTEMRRRAVDHVTEHPKESVVILVPRAKLGDEQIKVLREEHSDKQFVAKVWRGRHREDPETPDPDHAGKFRLMCWRSPEAKELEDHLINVSSHLCKRGRGKKKVKCAFEHEMRRRAVDHVTEHPKESVVILVPRAKLGDEQIKVLREEHSDKQFVAKVWRGRHREDPETPDPDHAGKFRLMCWRSPEAKELEDHLINVSSHLCKRGRGKKKVKCAFEPLCGYQRQQQVSANIWFAAHEMMVHEMPTAFGKVGLVMVDETPIDAFTFGTEAAAPFTIALDALRVGPNRDFAGRDDLMEARLALYRALDKIKPPPDDPHLGAPVGEDYLREFARQPGEPEFDPGMSLEQRFFARVNAAFLGGWARFEPGKMSALEWHGKVEPKIRPDSSATQVRKLLRQAEGNSQISRLATMWQLINSISRAQTGAGRIQIHRSEQGRLIRMVGLPEIADGWDVPTLICDATGDAELLRGIWPELESETNDWEQMPRPANVKVTQCVDRARSKYVVAIEGEGEKLKQRTASARRLYSAVLVKALAYGGRDVGVITYKSTKEWILANCLVPPWLKLLHHGDVSGSNALQHVRALFVIGRPLASAEAVTRMTEALFGDYIAERDYRQRKKHGRIPIVPDAAGNNVVLVDIWEHPDPRAEWMSRQVTEAALIQAIGRARVGQRGPGESLDIHLWTDVPLPELGPVEPVLWGEMETGLDGLMLATGGLWLENVTHAAKAYEKQALFTANTLKQARQRAQAQSAAKGEEWVHCLLDTTISNVSTPRSCAPISYQLAGAGQKPAGGVSLLGLSETRAWLEERLGALAKFEVIEPEAPAAAAAE